MAILIAGFEVDAALSETHSFESEVTEHPVENGADIADHVRARPISVQIDCVVSDTPIGTLVSSRSDTSLPSSDALAKLMQIRDEREPVTISTALRTYDNMVLQSLSIPVDATTGYALRFSATFTQIQLVTNERTTVRVSLPRASKKVDLGNKSSEPVATAPRVAPSVDTTRPPVRRVSTPGTDPFTGEPRPPFAPEGKVSLTSTAGSSPFGV
jgi:hypothetical protein